MNMYFKWVQLMCLYAERGCFAVAKPRLRLQNKFGKTIELNHGRCAELNRNVIESRHPFECFRYKL